MKSLIVKLGMLVAMLLSFLPLSAYDFEVDGIYYEVISITDLTCSVVSGEKKYSGDIEVPAKITYNNREFSVTTIGPGAFFDCSSLVSCIFPNSVTTIEYSAFSECRSLISVIIPESVSKIGNNAFSGCWSLEYIDLPNSLTLIEAYTFDHCNSLKTINIPESVTTIGRYAFLGCKSLSSLIIPNSVTMIEEGAFASCEALQSISLSENISELNLRLFSNCVMLESLSIPGSVQDLFLYYQHTDKWSYTNDLFRDCKNLNKLCIQYDLYPLKAKCIKDGTVNGVYDKYTAKTELSFSYYDFYNRNINLPIKEVFIDRELDNNISLPYLIDYTIGEHITENQVELNKSEKLETIFCYALNPPVLGEVSNMQYMNVVVKVPNQSLELYQQAEGWRDFWNLQGFNPSGVDVIVDNPMEKIEIGRYNLNGQSVLENYEGIIVIRYSDGSTQKVISHKNN